MILWYTYIYMRLNNDSWLILINLAVPLIQTVKLWMSIICRSTFRRVYICIHCTKMIIVYRLQACEWINCAGILEQSMGARNRLGIGLSYRPARARICKRLRSTGNNFKVSIRHVALAGRYVKHCCCTSPPLKGLQIRAQVTYTGRLKSLKIPAHYS